MARTRRARPESLSSSWDPVDDSGFEDTDEEVGPEPQPEPQRRVERSSRATRSSKVEIQEEPRRTRQSAAHTEFIMPASPDAIRTRTKASNVRQSTPHFRLNQRSLTSDAGKHNKMRATTPHFRLSERSLTSDAGLFRRGSKSDLVDDEVDERSIEGVVNVVFTRLFRPLLSYLVDIAGLALNNLKPLLGYVLLLYILVGGAVFGVGFLTNSINHALTPICRIPGASFLHLPFCPKPNAPELKGPAEFDRLVEVQSAFDEVLSTSSVGATLPLDMKRSEAGIRDLKHVVEYSTLPSRHELVFEFSGFIDTARQASQDLSRFNSRIGRAVDHILSTNRWTLSVIDGVSATENSKGSISRWVGNNLNIFAPFQPVSLSRDVLLDQYLRHTGAVEEQILSLISEAQALLNILDNLDGRLDVIASIATRDGIKVGANKDELFANLWTKLGGNRSSVQRLQNQLDLLKDVGAYRRIAWAHVTTTIVKLQAIRDNLEDLRERVALPETVGDRVPLEVHIDSINLGIERLEKQRENSRKVEAENYARVISRAEEGEKQKSIGNKREL